MNWARWRSNEMWAEIYDRMAALVRGKSHHAGLRQHAATSRAHRSRLGERLGEGAVLPHHGSLSRRLRLEAEQRLKRGELRAVVATASLELGIDIGTVDLVCQIGSPRSIAVALQRVGRAGHWVGALPKGRLFATTRDELIECAALVRAIRARRAGSSGDSARAAGYSGAADRRHGGLRRLGRRRAVQRLCARVSLSQLARRDFDAVVEMLSEGIATSRGRRGALLHRDQVNHRLRGRRGARLMAITNGGAIPETAQYQVVAEPEGTVVGTLDEDFAVESLAGDVFLLGTTSWRIKRVETGRVRVEDAHGAAPSIPFWRGEAPGRTRELSHEVSGLREEIADRERPRTRRDADVGMLASIAWARSRRWNTSAPVHVRWARCRAKTPWSPNDFFDEGGGMQLVIHAPFGSRINRAWGLALRKRFCRTFNFELQAAATDNGLVLSLSDQHSFPLEVVFSFLRPDTVEHVLTQAMLAAPMFGARWKWNASRALAVPRFLGGHKVPPPIQRMRADDLLAAVFPDQVACAENLTGEIRIPDHPLVNETIDNCLHEAMDLDGLIAILERIEEGTLQNRRRRHAGAVAVLPRDSERESVRVSGRRAARRAPHARGAASP